MATEEQRLRMLQQLRSRPRGQADAPELTAHFPRLDIPVRAALDDAIDLMGRLLGRTRYLEEWREVQTAEQHDQGTGLDPLSSPDAWIAHEMGASDRQGSQSYGWDILAFSRQIVQDDPRLYAAHMSGSGGLAHPLGSTVRIGCARTDPDHNMTLAEYRTVIDILIAWRRPVYIAVGSSNYGVYDRVYDHRAWGGWIGWFPQTIRAADLPAETIVDPLGGGTLVAVQETNVVARLEEQRRRSQDVEVALAQLGVLPTLESLRQ